MASTPAARVAAKKAPGKKPPAKKAAPSPNRKPSASDAFHANMSDADTLLAIAKLLKNNRRQGMRVEMKRRVGAALGIGKKRWNELSCLENEQIFVAFKPGSAVLLENLNE